MIQAIPSDSKLSLVPLGAGDLIDRAVRFYRQNFWTFIMIAAPPVVAGTLISVGWTVLARALFSLCPAVSNPAPPGLNATTLIQKIKT